ncbi:MAG: NAD(P)H-hydrate epimerase [Phycisphaerae bacterium]
MANPDSNIHLTRPQVREVDRRAIEELHIPGIILMENAGRNAANIIRQRFEERRASSRGDGGVAIICGKGNNGGDGFVIARHLANARIPVEIWLACNPDGLTGDAETNFNIVRQMNLPRHTFNKADRIAATGIKLQSADILIDAVLGTGFHGQVRAPLDAVIEAINRAENTWKFAIDLPSGLDCDTGRPSNATVHANETITFVARKAGFATSGSNVYTGRVHVADIGAPPGLIQTVLSGDSSG